MLKRKLTHGERVVPYRVMGCKSVMHGEGVFHV